MYDNDKMGGVIHPCHQYPLTLLIILNDKYRKHLVVIYSMNEQVFLNWYKKNQNRLYE